MCRKYGGFDATVLESAAASTAALDTDWRPIQDGTAIAVMAEATARAVGPAEVAVVPIQPPPYSFSPWRGGTASALRLLTSASATFAPTPTGTPGPQPRICAAQPHSPPKP